MPVLGGNFCAHFTWPGTYPVRRTRRWNCRLQGALTFWDDSGGKLHRPTVNAYLPEAMAQTGDVDNALRLIDKQIVQIERPGWEERYFYAELLRLDGWMLSLKGNLEGAERSYLSSLGWARPPAGENVGAAHLD
jgi:hypothetical protein